MELMGSARSALLVLSMQHVSIQMYCMFSHRATSAHFLILSNRCMHRIDQTVCPLPMPAAQLEQILERDLLIAPGVGQYGVWRHVLTIDLGKFD